MLPKIYIPEYAGGADQADEGTYSVTSAVIGSHNLSVVWVGGAASMVMRMQVWIVEGSTLIHLVDDRFVTSSSLYAPVYGVAAAFNAVVEEQAARAGWSLSQPYKVRLRAYDIGSDNADDFHDIDMMVRYCDPANSLRAVRSGSALPLLKATLEDIMSSQATVHRRSALVPARVLQRDISAGLDFFFNRAESESDAAQVEVCCAVRASAADTEESIISPVMAADTVTYAYMSPGLYPLRRRYRPAMPSGLFPFSSAATLANALGVAAARPLSVVITSGPRRRALFLDPRPFDVCFRFFNDFGEWEEMFFHAHVTVGWGDDITVMQSSARLYRFRTASEMPFKVSLSGLDLDDVAALRSLARSPKAQATFDEEGEPADIIITQLDVNEESDYVPAEATVTFRFASLFGAAGDFRSGNGRIHTNEFTDTFN